MKTTTLGILACLMVAPSGAQAADLCATGSSAQKLKCLSKAVTTLTTEYDTLKGQYDSLNTALQSLASKEAKDVSDLNSRKISNVSFVNSADRDYDKVDVPLYCPGENTVARGLMHGSEHNDIKLYCYQLKIDKQ
jgi:hypothetical protein